MVQLMNEYPNTPSQTVRRRLAIASSELSAVSNAVGVGTAPAAPVPPGTKFANTGRKAKSFHGLTVTARLQSLQSQLNALRATFTKNRAYCAQPIVATRQTPMT